MQARPKQVPENKKGGGRQGALYSAGRPNLQGRSIQFQHALQVEDTTTDSDQWERALEFQIQLSCVG